MKIARKDIKSSGLSVVYDPDNRTDVNLEYDIYDCVHSQPLLTAISIILVHGLGGHPVRTWLHTPARQAPAKEVPSEELTTSENEPVRALSLRHLASPNLKKGNTLKKPRNGRASPQLRVFGSPLRPRSDDFSDVTGGSSENIAGPRAGRAPRRGSRRTRRAPVSKQSPTTPSKPIFEKWTSDGEEPEGARDLGTFWPADLLPDLCSDARILTWGFRTRLADGMIVPGQLDIFSRGRELLNDVNDLLASYREHGQSREVVFVAHSTGGIVIKEVTKRTYLLRPSLFFLADLLPDAPPSPLVRRHTKQAPAHIDSRHGFHRMSAAGLAQRNHVGSHKVHGSRCDRRRDPRPCSSRASRRGYITGLRGPGRL